MWETSIVLHLFMRALFQILGTVRHCSWPIYFKNEQTFKFSEHHPGSSHSCPITILLF